MNSCHLKIIAVVFGSVSCGLIEVEIMESAPVLYSIFISFFSRRIKNNKRSR